MAEERSLFDLVFTPRHYLTCSCGGRLTTEDLTLAREWIAAHKDHGPPPKTPTA